MKGRGLLPLNIRNFIPSLYNEFPDDAGEALWDKIDQLVDDIMNDIIDLTHLYDPMRCPAEYLDNLGQKFSADIRENDSEAVKRKKIVNAIAQHKSRGLWDEDIKIRIQNITGVEPEIFSNTNDPDLEDYIYMGDGLDEERMWSLYGGLGDYEPQQQDPDPDFIYLGDGTDESENWSIYSSPEITSDPAPEYVGEPAVTFPYDPPPYGMLYVGEGDESFLPGNIYIDLKNASLNQTTIDLIVDELLVDGGFAYYRIFLGFVSVGQFNLYQEV